MSIEQFALYFLREKYKIADKQQNFCDMLSNFVNEMRLHANLGSFHNSKFRDLIDQKFNPNDQHDC